MEILADWLSGQVGNIIVLYDLEGRRYEGKIERVFADFFQIFEIKQLLSKVFRFSCVKDLSIKEVSNGS